jgi:Ca2+-binding EF-hand superfamily protein
MRNLTLGTLATALVLTALPALASNGQRAGGPFLPEFGQLDRDGSGSFSRDDLIAWFQERGAGWQDQIVARIMEQADEDGKLDETRLRAALSAMAESRLQAQAARGPGQMGERMFSRIDRNNDGAVSADEYAAFLERAQRGRDQRGREHRGKRLAD